MAQGLSTIALANGPVLRSLLAKEDQNVEKPVSSLEEKIGLSRVVGRELITP